jgi:transposase
MIDADKRKAVFALHQQGMGVREISRRLRMGRNTVRRIIAAKGQMPRGTRSDKQCIDPELLKDLYKQCDGRAQRVHEKLVEERGIEVTYSTLTRMLREEGISTPPTNRCDQRADEPGAEMQHDTTVYQIELGGTRTRLVASVLYMRYCKRRYLKFYRFFNRFIMKCFLHEALTFWKYAAPLCIIDNTNLARVVGSGTGAAAMIVPEMVAFGKQYGFGFLCHALRHANRKAGNERSFYTVETNFLPGRTFRSLEDLNAQAFEWATVRMDNKAQGKANIIPAKAFEHECAYLTELPPHLPPPYQPHRRGTDQYGYAAFAANYYWVPGTKREDVSLLEYSNKLKILLGRQCLAEYPLPADGVKNQKFAPPGEPAPPHNPNNRKRPTKQEEQRLRDIDPSVSRYLDFALKPKGRARHQFLRRLFALSRQMTPALFIKTIERALRYRIDCLDTLRNIARLSLSESDSILPVADIDESFRARDTYLEGRLTDPPDFSAYDRMLDEQPESDEDKQEDRENG